MRKDLKKSIYDKIITTDRSHESTNLLVMTSYLDPFCFADLYIINRLRKANIFDDNEVQIMPYDIYSKTIADWLLMFSVDEEHYYCETMVSIGGEIWHKVNTVYSISSILLNGESQSYAASFAHNYMIKYAGVLQEKLRNGEVIPEIDSEELVKNYSDTSGQDKRIVIRLSSIYPHISESESITQKAYEGYLGKVADINRFLMANYFDKIEGDGILSEMVNDLGFE